MIKPRRPSGIPSTEEMHPRHLRFLEQVATDDIVVELEALTDESLRILRSVPPEKETFRYAPGKWSVRELVGHAIDAERIFCVRVLATSRGDTGELHTFDDKLYTANSGYDEVPLADLIEEFDAVRRATLLLLKKIDPVQWTRTAKIGGYHPSTRGVAWTIAGHSIHHFRFLKQHYL